MPVERGDVEPTIDERGASIAEEEVGDGEFEEAAVISVPRSG